MLLCIYKRKIATVVVKSGIKKFTVSYMIFVLYWIFIVIINFILGERIFIRNYITIFYQMILLTPIMTSCVAYIIVRAETLNYSVEQLLVHFIMAGAIEGAISLMAFISPVIRQLCIQIMQKSNGNVFSEYILSRRIYGFANGLYDLFGWGTGILAASPLFLDKKLRKKYMWFVPILLLPPLLNARTGLVMFGVGVAMFVLFINNESFFSFFGKVLFILIGVIAGYYIFKWVKEKNITTYVWILEGLKALWGTISNGQNTNLKLSVLFSKRFWSIPPFPYIILGTGHNIYIGRASIYSANMRYANSDVGYINYLWMGGIVGSVMLYRIYFKLFIVAIKSNLNKRIKWLLIFYGGSIVLFNIKGQAFTHCPATALFFTIVFYSIFIKKKDRN